MGDLDFDTVMNLMDKTDKDGDKAAAEASPVSNGALRSKAADGGPRRSSDSEGPPGRENRREGRERSQDDPRRGGEGSSPSSRRGGPRPDESPEGRKGRGDSSSARRPSRGGDSTEGRRGGGPRGESSEGRRCPRGQSPEGRRGWGGRGGSPEVYREGRRSPSPRRNGGWRDGPWPRGPRGREFRSRGPGGPFRRFGDDYGRHRGGDFRRRDREREWWPPAGRRSRSRDRPRRDVGRSASPGRRGGNGQSGGGGGGPAVSGASGENQATAGSTATRLGPREELLRRQREEELRRKEVEEARRDDLTVLVLNLSLKADERHIYEFFSANAGKIRDIQQIRDQRSGVSKGVAYVEFYTQEAVIKAMALNGISFKGQPLRVQASMAEKNRAARAAKCPIAPAPDAASLQIPMRVYVGGLVGSLASLTKDDLHALFSPFGAIQEIILPIDPNTGEGVGFAFIMFSATGDAHDAMQQMHKFKIGGQELRVGYAADGVRLSGSLPEGSPTTPPGGIAAPQGAPGLLGGPGIPAHVVAATQVSYEAQLAKQLAEKAASLMRQQQPQQAQEGQAQAQDGDDEGGLDDDDMGFIHDPSRKQALMQKLMDRSNAALASTGGSRPAVSPSSEPQQQQQPQASPSTDKQQFLRSSSGPRVGVGGLAPGVMTSNLVLRGMFNPSAADDEYYFEDIRDDVKEECGKHGSVVQVSLSEKDEEGRVFVKFTAPSVALAAQNALNGRFFGGRQIHAEFATDAMINAVCGNSTTSSSSSSS
ncbi:splicing factor protein, putative [Eimeria maxima]|uniref:Splicing factor protein, putative n=1 Tax=Eimeria maxima TaxID=5804 RepID=U6MGQ3_EIMMA|nr:splicing factor protein, putative [Eimeria maxima]CDJ61624.1 splicing factor protein, putative [Eimeria maxima]